MQAVDRYCSVHGLVFQGEPCEDLGVDCYIEIAEDQRGLNFLVGVQCKCGSSYRSNVTEQGFSVRVSERDVAYWLASNIPVFFVYLDEKSDGLYFKHVQQEFADLSAVDHAKKIDFRFDTDVANERWAKYLRRLQTSTPNALSRIEIANNPVPAIIINEQEFSASPLPPSNSCELSKTLTDDPSAEGGIDLPRMSQVIGYSSDRSWVAVVQVSEIGQKCTDTSVCFVEIPALFEFSLPVEPEEDVDNVVTMTPGLMESRLKRVDAMLEKLQVKPGRLLYPIRDISDDAGYPDFIPEPKVSLRFGVEEFAVSLHRIGSSDRLMLSNSKYAPARTAVLDAYQVRRAPYMDVDGNLEPVIGPKGLSRLCAVATNLDHSIISFGFLTDASHPCWDNPHVAFCHFDIDSLRSRCLEALRV